MAPIIAPVPTIMTTVIPRVPPGFTVIIPVIAAIITPFAPIMATVPVVVGKSRGNGAECQDRGNGTGQESIDAHVMRMTKPLLLGVDHILLIASESFPAGNDS